MTTHHHITVIARDDPCSNTVYVVRIAPVDDDPPTYGVDTTWPVSHSSTNLGISVAGGNTRRSLRLIETVASGKGFAVSSTTSYSTPSRLLLLERDNTTPNQ